MIAIQLIQTHALMSVTNLPLFVSMLMFSGPTLITAHIQRLMCMLKGPSLLFENYASMFSITSCLQPFLVTGCFKNQDMGYQLIIASCLLFICYLVFLRSVRVIYRAALILQISVLISGCYLIFYIEFISSLTISLLFSHFDLHQFPCTLGYCLFLG